MMKKLKELLCWSVLLLLLLLFDTTRSSSQVSGWYSTEIAKVLGNRNKEDSLINWLRLNSASGSAYVSPYSFRSVIASNAAFPSFVERLSLRGIKVYVPYTTDAEVDAVLSYNARQSVGTRKIAGCVTEFETWTYDPNRDGKTDASEIIIADSIFKSLLLRNTYKLNLAGLESGVYTGWHNETLYPFIIKYADFLLIHSYRTAAQMNTPGDAFGYVCGKTDEQTTDRARWGRLTKYASYAAQQMKVVRFSLLASCEPEYGYDYFATAKMNKQFKEYYEQFLVDWNRFASARMKNWLRPNGAYYFKDSYGKAARP